MLPDDLDALTVLALDAKRCARVRATLVALGDAVPLRRVLALAAIEQAEDNVRRCLSSRAELYAAAWQAVADRLKANLDAAWLTSTVAVDALTLPRPDLIMTALNRAQRGEPPV